jgi:hypothetical protein
VKLPAQRLAILLPAAVPLFVLFILPAQLRPGNFLADDTYFYLQVAHEIVAGHGSTFNTITPTNGYHPLWMGLCIAAAWMAGGDKSAEIHIALAMGALLFVGIAWAFLALARSVGLRFGIAAIPLLALYFLTGLYGSEAHCNGLALAVALLLLSRCVADGSARRLVAAGLGLGVAVLARLDNVFIVAGFVAVLPFIGAGEGLGWGRWLRGLLPGLAAFTVVLPYLVINVLETGHVMPISGAIKSSFPIPHPDLARLGLLGIIVSTAAIVGILLSSVRVAGPALRLIVRGLGVGVLMQSAYILLFMRLGAGWSWYYVAGMLEMALVLALLLDLAASRGELRRVARGLAIGVATLLLLLVLARGWYRLYDAYFTQRDALFRPGAKRSSEDLRKLLALWMKEHLPPGSGVYVDDGAGAIAYYSDLRILPRDGLISDYRYNDELLRLGPAEYFRAHDIRYYLGPIDPRRNGSQLLTVPAPLYGRPAGRITLLDENILIVTKDNPERGDIALWEIPGEIQNSKF